MLFSLTFVAYYEFVLVTLAHVNLVWLWLHMYMRKLDIMWHFRRPA